MDSNKYYDRKLYLKLFASLQNRDYRLYYLSQLVSLNGTWMQTVAQSWLVYRLTESSTMLGIVTFSALIPVLLLTLPAGALADRVDQRKLLIAAHGLAALQAIILAILTLTGLIQVWQIIIMALLLGVIHAVEIPARHAFIAHSVPRDHLANAIALNSSAFNVARFIGPALAGWMVAQSSEGWVFVLNAVSYMVILFGFLRMRGDYQPESTTDEPTLTRIIYALRYAHRHKAIRDVLLLVAAASVAQSGVSVLMPVFATGVYGGDSRTLGLLLGSLGAGALAGAIRLAIYSSHTGQERTIVLSATVMGVSLLLFSQIESLLPGMLVLFIIGFCQSTQTASSNIAIQHIIPDSIRGRIMGLFSMVFIGLMPLGSLLSGLLADWILLTNVTIMFGLVMIAAAVWYVSTQRNRDSTSASENHSAVEDKRA
ncbi:MAG TPA: MFS transporter [Gammaproteobacteria bacterium]|nr:MFS transporter [Gammaproteobacteria bacterium]